MYNNDNTKLSKDFIVQIESMVKVAVGQRGKFDIKVKTQSSKTSNIYIYTENRKDTKRKLKAALRKKGSNFATGGGYRVRSKIFTGSNFSGLTYVVKQEGDKKSYKIILRFKEIFAGVKGAVKKKENFGMVFERLLAKDFKKFAKTKTADARGIKYKKFIRSFVNDVGLDDNVDLIDVIHAGGANTKRPLVFSGANIYVADKDPQIGNKVTDLTLNTSKGLEYLSLKYGGTVTFMNSGIKTLFPEREFRDGDIVNPDAEALLKLFGIDEKRFIDVFLTADNHSKSGKSIPKLASATSKDIVDVTGKINKTKLHNFLKTGVGYGYWMVHLKNAGSIDYFYISKNLLETWTRPDSVKILYPKKEYPAKRIDVLIDTPKFELKMNIRNKQGTVYPTHIMLDYKIKH